MVKLKPQHVSFLDQLARTCHLLGHYQEAITYFDKALAINAHNSEILAERDSALLAQANLWLQQNRYTDALNSYARISKLDSMVYTQLLAKGVQLLQANQLADALTFLSLS